MAQTQLCISIIEDVMRAIIKTLIFSTCTIIALPIFATQAILLVSLGMPDDVLKDYLSQGIQYHIPVVIRGLYTSAQDDSVDPMIGSLPDTVSRVKSLVKDNKLGGVSINPLVFRAFDVQAVPALVVYSDDTDCIAAAGHSISAKCPNNKYDIAFGNMSIPHQLNVIAQDSSNIVRSNYAKFLLSQYAVSGDR